MWAAMSQFQYSFAAAHGSFEERHHARAKLVGIYVHGAGLVCEPLPRHSVARLLMTLPLEPSHANPMPGHAEDESSWNETSIGLLSGPLYSVNGDDRFHKVVQELQMQEPPCAMLRNHSFPFSAISLPLHFFPFSLSFTFFTSFTFSYFIYFLLLLRHDRCARPLFLLASLDIRHRSIRLRFARRRTKSKDQQDHRMLCHRTTLHHVSRLQHHQPSSSLADAYIVVATLSCLSTALVAR